MSSRGWKWKKKKETKAGRTGVESRVLLDVAELLEAAVAVGAAVGLLAGVDADVLHQLVVRRERLETLLALVRLRVAAVRVPHVHLHRRFRHKNLESSMRIQILRALWGRSLNSTRSSETNGMG